MSINHQQAERIYPNYYLITGEPIAGIPTYLANLELALKSGIRLVLLRVKTLPQAEYFQLVKQSVLLCKQYQAIVLLHSYVDQVNELGTDGVHLPSKMLMNTQQRPLDDKHILCVACHDKAQIDQAIKINADFAVLSPVLKTSSSPGKTPLGWDAFHGIVSQTVLPIYALGGMSPQYLSTAKQHGAIGIAAIRAFWGK